MASIRCRNDLLATDRTSLVLRSSAVRIRHSLLRNPLGVTLFHASDSKGPQINTSNKEETGMFREAYSPAYTANKTINPSLSRSSRDLAASATSAISSSAAKHLGATP